MAFNHPQITQQEIDSNNLEGLPDIPGYSTVDMQKALDKLATMVAHKLNDLIAAMRTAGSGVPTLDDMAQAILNAEISAGSGDMLAGMYDPTNKEQDIFAYTDYNVGAVQTALGAVQGDVSNLQTDVSNLTADVSTRLLTNTAPITLYVSNTGSDGTGDGTQTNPYATIQKAVNELPKHLSFDATIYVNGDTAGGINLSNFDGAGILSILPKTSGQIYNITGKVEIKYCLCPIVVGYCRTSYVVPDNGGSIFDMNNNGSGLITLDNCG
ncbi:MAG: hypothetical protein ACOYIF_11020, partial [Acetivibrionales bacterium]